MFTWLRVNIYEFINVFCLRESMTTADSSSHRVLRVSWTNDYCRFIQHNIHIYGNALYMWMSGWSLWCQKCHITPIRLHFFILFCHSVRLNRRRRFSVYLCVCDFSRIRLCYLLGCHLTTSTDKWISHVNHHWRNRWSEWWLVII